MNADLVILIFWLTVFGILMLIRRSNINRALHRMWQDTQVLLHYGVESDRLKEQLKNIDDVKTRNKELKIEYEAAYDTLHGTTMSRYSYAGVMNALCKSKPEYCGSGLILLAIQVNAYADKMSPMSLKFRDYIFSRWKGSRPQNWREEYVFKVEGKEYMEELDTVVAGMCHCFFTLPPDIKAKMEDEKERSRLLRQLNIE